MRAKPPLRSSPGEPQTRARRSCRCEIGSPPAGERDHLGGAALALGLEREALAGREARRLLRRERRLQLEPGALQLEQRLTGRDEVPGRDPLAWTGRRTARGSEVYWSEVLRTLAAASARARSGWAASSSDGRRRALGQQRGETPSVGGPPRPAPPLPRGAARGGRRRRATPGAAPPALARPHRRRRRAQSPRVASRWSRAGPPPAPPGRIGPPRRATRRPRRSAPASACSSPRPCARARPVRPSKRTGSSSWLHSFDGLSQREVELRPRDPELELTAQQEGAGARQARLGVEHLRER